MFYNGGGNIPYQVKTLPKNYILVGVESPNRIIRIDLRNVKNVKKFGKKHEKNVTHITSFMGLDGKEVIVSVDDLYTHVYGINGSVKKKIEFRDGKCALQVSQSFMVLSKYSFKERDQIFSIRMGGKGRKYEMQRLDTFKYHRKITSFCSVPGWISKFVVCSGDRYLVTYSTKNQWKEKKVEDQNSIFSLEKCENKVGFAEKIYQVLGIEDSSSQKNDRTLVFRGLSDIYVAFVLVNSIGNNIRNNVYQSIKIDGRISSNLSISKDRKYLSFFSRKGKTKNGEVFLYEISEERIIKLEKIKSFVVYMNQKDFICNFSCICGYCSLFYGKTNETNGKLGLICSAKNVTILFKDLLNSDKVELLCSSSYGGSVLKFLKSKPNYLITKRSVDVLVKVNLENKEITEFDKTRDSNGVISSYESFFDGHCKEVIVLSRSFSLEFWSIDGNFIKSVENPNITSMVSISRNVLLFGGSFGTIFTFSNYECKKEFRRCQEFSILSMYVISKDEKIVYVIAQEDSKDLKDNNATYKLSVKNNKGRRRKRN